MSYSANTRTILDTGADDGVSINDVQRALGNGSHNVGTLCTAPSINKWATFKPMPTGTVSTINKNGTAPYGLRTIYRMINPNNGELLSNTSSVRTKLYDAVQAIKLALLSGTNNPFLEDLTMYVRPTGGTNSAYRLTDFVSTHGIDGGQMKCQDGVHGYKANASLRYGYYNQRGVYSGIGRAISINSDGHIVADSDQSIDTSYTEMWGDPYYNLNTRIGWGRAVENDLCVLDWLDSMFGASRYTNLHRGIVLFTNDGVETRDWVAVQTIPWASSSMSLPSSTFTWNCIEFLTTANVNTSSEFIDLTNWNYENENNHWMLIPGMIFTGLTFENHNPYGIGAYFIRAEVSPFQHVFNLQMAVTNMGQNSSLTVFLSETPNPTSIRDFLLNSNTGYTITSTGEYFIYGASNSGIPMYPSGSGMSNDFDKVFNVGQTYYLCIWGQSNQAGSSAGVIWSDALVASSDDSLIIAHV